MDNQRGIAFLGWRETVVKSDGRYVSAPEREAVRFQQSVELAIGEFQIPRAVRRIDKLTEDVMNQGWPRGGRWGWDGQKRHTQQVIRRTAIPREALADGKSSA